MPDPALDPFAWPVERGEVEAAVAAALDEDFYRRTHPELPPEADVVRHYLTIGHEAGWRPTPDFDTAWYLSRNPDVAEAGLNAFYHWLRWGRVEGRAPNAAAVEEAARPVNAAERLIAPHVDGAFYRGQSEAVARTPVNPAKHYLHFGWHAGLDPSPAFSTRFYRASPYETDAHENPLHHFLRVGRDRGRLPRPLLGEGVGLLSGPAVEAALRPAFDADWYRAAYPELGDALTDPLKHYLAHGWLDGRDPTPEFSTSGYLARFPDAAVVGCNPFLHWLLWGREQGFRPGFGAPHGRPTSGVAAELRPWASTPRAPEGPPPPMVMSNLNIHWIIPDVESPGRGGHMTLFRLIRWLEVLGHGCTVWVNDPHPDFSDAERAALVQRSYQAIAAPVGVLGPETRFPPDALVVATSWTTALVMAAAPSARARFHLVQDDEAAFHPAGASALAATQTLDKDVGYLCAGEWLAGRLASRGRWARSFELAPDPLQRPASAPRPGERARIAFYGRAGTPRRAVELGLLAFEALAERGVAFEVHRFGDPQPLRTAAFPVVEHGVLDAAELGDLYGRCDLGLCFSATNHSLIPGEMMACGLPVVELDGESARAAFPGDVVAFAPPDPAGVADVLERLLADAPARAALGERARAWIAGRSWERSARTVEAAMRERLADLGAQRSPQGRLASPALMASVLIPAFNAGPAFEGVLDAVLGQRTPWRFEIVVFDSGSDDGTWERLQARPEIRLRRIPQSEFQHGRTRNALAAEARGEVLVFITQDAEPASPLWLADLVAALERHPRAAGAFGRHLPRSDASPFTKRDLHGFFRRLGAQPLERSKFWDLERWNGGDEAFRRELHFFSSNNAALRRSVWSRLPLPEVDYGEDQLWAARVLQHRYSLVYAPTAAVIHSHEYDEAGRHARSRIEGRWWRDSFGYRRVVPDDPEVHVARMNAGDERWGVRNGVPADEIARKQRLNAAEVAGLLAGWTEP